MEWTDEINPTRPIRKQIHKTSFSFLTYLFEEENFIQIQFGTTEPMTSLKTVAPKKEEEKNISSYLELVRGPKVKK